MVYVLYSSIYPLLSSGQFDNYLESLPVSLQEKICGLRKAEDAQASLYGKILLRNGLINYYQANNNVLDNLYYSENGKPLLRDPKINFNISHAGRYVVCAISEEASVGIDLEEISPVNPFEFREQFSAEEFSAIQASPDKSLSFFNHWVKKEAVAKAIGAGLTVSFQNINFTEKENGPESFGGRYYLREIPIDKKHCCWLALDKRSGKVAVKSVSGLSLISTAQTRQIFL